MARNIRAGNVKWKGTCRMKIVVSGFKGKMGTACTNMVLREEGFTLAAVYDPFATEKQLDELPQYAGNPVKVFRDKEALVKEVEADVWIDFSRPEAAYANTRFALENGLRPVIGTTGFSSEQLEELTSYSKELGLGGLIAPNFAIGAVLMMEFAAKAAKYFPDVEIMELHHENKLDAPSGTAIKTAELIYEVRGDHQQGHPEEKELIEGARGADYHGMKIHSVRLPGLVAHQQVQFGSAGEGLIIRHDSYDRDSFMSGVALSCRKVMETDRLIYGLENFL